MAWRIIQQPNGLYARFSEVVDDVTHFDMTYEESVEVCCEYMGRRDAPSKVEIAEGHPERYDEAIRIIREIHGAELATVRHTQMTQPAG